MGTPDFAVGSLEALIGAGHEVTAVVTQPDKPKGRSGKLQFSPVKECALRFDIPVLQPDKIRKPEAVEELKKYAADIIVVAAFGQILPREVLELAPLGCINVHASLLPKYRGASPINWCIINGESVTGVTIMQMNEGLDEGDILSRVEVPVADDDTAGSLFEKLGAAGARLLADTLPLIERGEITPVKQNGAESTYTRVMSKTLGKIDWEKSAAQIERLVRGLNPWPGTYTYMDGKSVKLWKCGAVEGGENTDRAGEIISIGKDYIEVSCGSGSLKIFELQLEGKKRMDAKSFLLGNRWTEGMKFICQTQK